MLPDDLGDAGLTRVGLPMEVVRTLDPVYLDQARADFEDYLRKTLSASQTSGGRFNPPGEFGALYTASDEDTAWAEAAARFTREGVDGLPPEMGMLRILITTGIFADSTSEDALRTWKLDENALITANPIESDRDACWSTARAVRAMADFLVSRSARAAGHNIPLFTDREGGELELSLRAASKRRPPDDFLQEPRESW